MQSVRLEELAMMHQKPHLQGSWRQSVDPDNTIDRFCGGQVMADRTDPTQSLHQNRKFPEGSSLDESLKASELYNVEARLLNPCLVVQKDGDLTMPFNPGDRFYDNPPALTCIAHSGPL